MSFSVTAIGAAPNSIGDAQIINGSITAEKNNPNRVAGTPADPAPTASATFIMAGLAIPFTPSQSGEVRIIISGNMNNSAPGDGGHVKIAYGSGVAPVNGVALTGTVVGNTAGTLLSSAASQKQGFTLIALVTGLVLATALWFDLQYQVITGGSMTVTDLSYTIEEI